MTKITFQTCYYELHPLHEYMRNCPPAGRDVQSLFCMSILRELESKLLIKCYAWEHQKNKKHKLTWSNHTARAVAVYLSGLLGGGKVTDTYNRSCLDMLRLNLLQKLA